MTSAGSRWGQAAKDRALWNSLQKSSSGRQLVEMMIMMMMCDSEPSYKYVAQMGIARDHVSELQVINNRRLIARLLPFVGGLMTVRVIIGRGETPKMCRIESPAGNEDLRARRMLAHVLSTYRCMYD
ncbi:jg6836 [Pararge aegeria aegeria]|uniref:Jg6836 protein n=1 Tax=Pararge aegeria aegeria TaxID=348720 RepID=A0A8S4RQM6_9NEOP|nr:jg6836 [Pararge aegeria aegeria]